MDNKDFYTLEELEDEYIGKRGTPKREAYEADIEAYVNKHNSRNNVDNQDDQTISLPT